MCNLSYLQGVSMIKKATHVTLFTNDQDAAMKFYVDTLGLKVHTDVQYGDMRWLTLCPKDQEDFEIVIMKATKPESQAVVGKQSPEGPFLVFETEDCQGDFERLKAAGVTFTQEPTQKQWGLEALLADPDGNIIDLIQI